MQIAKGATIAVADGQKLSLFHNTGDEANPKLTAVPVGDISTSNKSGGTGHASSAANPDDSQQDEDGFAAGIAEHLNAQAVSGKLKSLIVIAAPRTLGELRKHYHAKLKDVLAGEISKDLTGQTSDDIEKAIASA
jgi:protein required for attachment to host cells